MNVFISCVAEKADHRAPAKELYISPLFKKNLAYARSLKPDHIYILSAKHYVLGLNDVIEPYNETLNDMDSDERKEWADKVIDMCRKKHISLSEKTVFLAGDNYIDYLKDKFNDYTVPCDGLAIGETMHWLDEHTPKKYRDDIEECVMDSISNTIKKSKTMRNISDILNEELNFLNESVLRSGSISKYKEGNTEIAVIEDNGAKQLFSMYDTKNGELDIIATNDIVEYIRDLWDMSTKDADIIGTLDVGESYSVPSTDELYTRLK